MRGRALPVTRLAPEASNTRTHSLAHSLTHTLTHTLTHLLSHKRKKEEKSGLGSKGRGREEGLGTSG